MYAKGKILSVRIRKFLLQRGFKAITLNFLDVEPVKW